MKIRNLYPYFRKFCVCVWSITAVLVICFYVYSFDQKENKDIADIELKEVMIAFIDYFNPFSGESQSPTDFFIN